MKHSHWHSLIVGLAAVLLGACAMLPAGTDRLARVEQLVERQEFAKAENLLADVDPTDPHYQELLVRRRALRPLIDQFEENTVQRVDSLKKADQWPAAEASLEEALDKLPHSEVLRKAEEQLRRDRAQRLEDIHRQMTLLKGQHLAAKAPLVQQAQQVDPGSVKTRWESFRYQREADELSEELLACGESALDEAHYDLAESCLEMAASLTDGEAVQEQLARLKQRREEDRARTAARREERQKAQRAARVARQQEEVEKLKARYRSLFDAGWWLAAKDILTQLRSEVPEDPEVQNWTSELQEVIRKQVERSIERGQALYTEGQLQEALSVWRSAAKLDPDNTVLQAHIARVERFLSKLKRLDDDA